MKIVEIHSEFMLCFSNDAYTLASVHHEVHEFEISRVSIEDDSQPGFPLLDDFDITILKRLLEAAFSSLYMSSDDLYIPKVTVWEHITMSIDLQYRYFK
jgi:hypothetical protein